MKLLSCLPWSPLETYPTRIVIGDAQAHNSRTALHYHLMAIACRTAHIKPICRDADNSWGIAADYNSS
jgi:hypothetical protein